MESLGERMFGRISRHGRGWVFSPEEFRDLADPRFVGMALTRLVTSGKIRRLARGLYYYPKKSPLLDVASPTPEAVARALAGRHNIRLIPFGAYAVNLLGLSDKAPAKSVFLTDGPSRTVCIGKKEVRLKQTTPRNMGPSGRKSGTVIQVLRHFGKKQVSDELIRALKDRLSAHEKKQLIEDMVFAPAWARIHLRAITEGAT